MTGILLIHGFAGNREELRPLQDYLSKHGFILSMPVLAGHEGTQKELSASKYQQWIESVDKPYSLINC